VNYSTIVIFVQYNSLLLIVLFFSVLQYNNYQKIAQNFRIQEFHLGLISILILFILTIFFTFRNIELGSDFVGYIENYNQLLTLETDLYPARSKEHLFIIANKLFVGLGLPSYIFYGFLSGITLYFIFKGFYRFVYLFPLGVFFILSIGFFFNMHTEVRQVISVAIFFYSVKFIIEHKPVRYIIAIIISFFIHQSSLILLLFYFISRKAVDRRIMIAIFLISIAGSFLHVTLFDIFTFFNRIVWLGLDEYRNHIGTSLVRNSGIERGTGIGLILVFIMNFLVIVASKRVLTIQPQLSVYYNFYFIQVILFNLFWDVEAIQRINEFFKVFSIIVFSATVYYAASIGEKFTSYFILFSSFLLFEAGVFRLTQYL
jgi:transmembrane protein EpsG